MLDTPNEVPEQLIKPEISTSCWPTVGPSGLRIPPELAAAARAAGSWRTLEKLNALTAPTDDLGFLGALVAFLSTKEVIVTLSRWADCDLRAKALEALGRSTWGYPGLTAAIRPFKLDQKSSKRMRGYLATQYLAAMAAAGRPAATETTNQFIQRLRTLCLVRALDAFDQGRIVQERSLSNVCATLRLVCDYPNDLLLGWLGPVMSTETDFDSFVADIQFKCAAAPKAATASQKSFYRDLRRVAAGGPWRTMQTANIPLGPADSWTGDEVSSPGAEIPYGFEAGAGSTDLLYPQTPDGSFEQVLTYPADLKSTFAKNARIGNGLMLEQIEDVQFLRQSWNHLTTEEEKHLTRRIAGLLETDNSLDRLGATLVLIACVASRSILAVGQIKITCQLSEDWSFDPGSLALHRRPPRFGRRWRAASLGPDQSLWLQPQAEQFKVILCPRATQLLKDLVKEVQHVTLDALWRANSPDQSLDTWFRLRFLVDPALLRLGPPSTSRVHQIQAYAQTFNHSLVRLLGSQTRTALPSASAYGAHHGPEVVRSLSIDAPQMFTVVEPQQDPDLNCCGSEIDVLPTRIRESIADLIDRCNEAAQRSELGVDYHNLLSSLCVIALLASTGARPVNSPFESSAHFDMAQRMLLTQDKVSGPTLGTRICILSDFAHDLLCRVYWPHLARLSKYLTAKAPMISQEIDRIVARDPEARLPQLFFLRDAPILDWQEISESQLSVESAVAWPLPWNIFRHLHATELSRGGVEQEIIDALLAHADGLAESHGDLSIRIPLDDLNSARHVINHLQQQWGFEEASVMASTSPFRFISVKEPDLLATRPYGKTARERNRQASRELAQKQAQLDIDALVGTRPPSSLTPGNWHDIGLKMLFRADNVRHNFASQRYEVFERYLSSIWQEKGVLTRMRRVFTISPPRTSIFTDDLICAAENLSTLKANFETLQHTVDGPRVGSRIAGILAAIELILNCRVTHRPALLDLVCLRPSVKLVRFQGRYWFERSYAETWSDGRPMFRACVTERAARWISIAIRGPNQLRNVPDLPKELEAMLPAHTSRSMKLVIDHLADIQNQQNALELPGTDAAYLGGRQIFSALPHRDWYRVHVGKAPLYDGATGSQDATELADLAAQKIYVMANVGKAKPAAANEASTPENCRLLFDGITKAIARDDAQPRQCISSIELAVAESIYGRGDLPYALASFICELLSRRPKKGERDNLRLSTVRRSWYALFQPIRDLGHDKNTYDLDEDEVTDLYGDMIDWWQKHFAGTPSSNPADTNSAGASEMPRSRLSAKERAADAGQRTLEALKEFHGYLEQAFGACSPEWAAVSDEAAGIIGRPGFVLLSEYLLGLQKILNNVAASDLTETDLQCAFTWIICAKFGTRIGEAVGLGRHDWIDIDGAIVLTVQGNSIRTLKTARSRRKIPLLESLTERERQVIDEVLRRWVLRNKSFQNSALLPGISPPTFQRIRSIIGERLGSLVKEVTSNDSSVVHMLRHSYACRVFSLLRAEPLGLADGYTEAGSEHVRRLLLGRNQSDRRVLWSICRLLGHARPSMAARCYLHGLDHWLPKPSLDMVASGLIPTIEGCLDLDLLQQVPHYGSFCPDAKRQSHASRGRLDRHVSYLHLLVRGQGEISARLNSLIDLEAAESLELLLAGVARRSGAAAGSADTNSLVNSIRFDRWLELQQLCAAVPEVPKAGVTFDVLETVGRRRQIVLFRSLHFGEFSAFVRTFGFTPADICIVRSPGLNEKVVEWMGDLGLIDYICTTERLGKRFQLDTAEDASKLGEVPLTVRHRVVCVPSPKTSRLPMTQIVLVLWLCWNVARGTQIPKVAPSPNAH